MNPFVPHGTLKQYYFYSCSEIPSFPEIEFDTMLYLIVKVLCCGCEYNFVNLLNGSFFRTFPSRFDILMLWVSVYDRNEKVVFLTFTKSNALYFRNVSLHYSLYKPFQYVLHTLTKNTIRLTQIRTLLL